jgi:hypothetical protein
VKNLLKASFAVGVAIASLSATSQAQTVAVNGLGSSAMFLELGLAASSATTASPAGLGATCLWTENTNTVVATDTSAGTPGLTDAGSAFVAWTPGTGTCAAPVSPTIYAYLQTDSVVGNRCLFNGTACTVKYPTSDPASANIILSSGEVALPTTVANALNSAAVNVAGTDIRPEDAEFAVTRATTNCGTAVATGSQYLGLGYGNGTTVDSTFSSSTFNVLKFTLPSAFSVTPLGATPIVVVVNSGSASTGFNAAGITNLTSQALSLYLDGTNSYTNQALSTPAATGAAVTTIIREPLSGTYNTMEYNEPNTSNATTGFHTSQDVGLDQPAAQQNCSGTSVGTNPLNIATPSGGARKRAIGTGQELSEVISTSVVPVGGSVASLGYGFWSVANYKGYTSAAAPFARYVTVDGVDPLLNASTPYSTYNGTLPLAGTAEIANVNLANVANGSYPIWSLLRLVNTGSTPLAAVTSLATASQNFVPSGTTSGRPDFVQATSLSVLRSHFIPPAGAGEPTTASNGHGSDTSSACSATEAGGDVGGVVITLTADSRYCSTHGVTTGQTGERR